jgi:integrase
MITGIGDHLRPEWPITITGMRSFRSTFRDWAAETTGFPSEVVEMALAHIVADKLEAAYRRGDLFAKRRRLMEAWAKFCEARRVPGDVVSLPLGSNQPVSSAG